tara:strand:- start:635 stop:1006 length:372 start_codon:yes stop_codon:yes gene_type:complete
MDLSTSLSQFVRVFNIIGVLNPQDMLFMYTAVLVTQHMNKTIPTPINEFNSIIEEKHLQNKITGAFICDFQPGEVQKMIEVTETYNGRWETKLPNTNDPEDNEFYAVFSTPMDAYAFMREAIA